MTALCYLTKNWPFPINLSRGDIWQLLDEDDDFVGEYEDDMLLGVFLVGFGKEESVWNRFYQPIQV